MCFSFWPLWKFERFAVKWIIWHHKKTVQSIRKKWTLQEESEYDFQFSIHWTLKICLIPISFRLYLRLFVVMGLTYSISGLSFMISGSSTFSEWTEIFLSLQGVWIFVLFVLKRRVFHLINERCVCALKSAQHSNRTVATTYIWSVCFDYPPKKRNEIQITRIIKLVFHFQFFYDLDGMDMKVYLRHKDSSIEGKQIGSLSSNAVINWMYARCGYYFMLENFLFDE